MELDQNQVLSHRFPSAEVSIHLGSECGETKQTQPVAAGGVKPRLIFPSKDSVSPTAKK